MFSVYEYAVFMLKRFNVSRLPFSCTYIRSQKTSNYFREAVKQRKTTLKEVEQHPATKTTFVASQPQMSHI